MASLETLSILGKGVYDIGEAAKLTRLRPARVRELFFGGRNGRGVRPLFESDHPPVAGSCSISFLNLVELFIGGRLREIGVPLQSLRKVYGQLESEYGEHPFCSGQIQKITRGAAAKRTEIFTRGLEGVERA